MVTFNELLHKFEAPTIHADFLSLKIFVRSPWLPGSLSVIGVDAGVARRHPQDFLPNLPSQGLILPSESHAYHTDQ
jgi:hypothetical protein